MCAVVGLGFQSGLILTWCLKQFRHVHLFVDKNYVQMRNGLGLGGALLTRRPV